MSQAEASERFPGSPGARRAPGLGGWSPAASLLLRLPPPAASAWCHTWKPSSQGDWLGRPASSRSRVVKQPQCPGRQQWFSTFLQPRGQTGTFALHPKAGSQGGPPLPSESGLHFLPLIQYCPARSVGWAAVVTLALLGPLGHWVSAGTLHSSQAWCPFPECGCAAQSSPSPVMRFSLPSSSSRQLPSELSPGASSFAASLRSRLPLYCCYTSHISLVHHSSHTAHLLNSSLHTHCLPSPVRGQGPPEASSCVPRNRGWQPLPVYM